jgi:hypothetical protein
MYPNVRGDGPKLVVERPPAPPRFRVVFNPDSLQEEAIADGQLIATFATEHEAWAALEVYRSSI